MNDTLRHRRALAERLPDGLILLSGGVSRTRNADTEALFRQRSDFLYLTDVEASGYTLLIDPQRGRQTLFIPRIDNQHRVWLGPVPGPAESQRLYGMRAVYADTLEKEFKISRRGYRKIYTDQETLKAHRPLMKGLHAAPARLADALSELRACKSPGELDMIRQACAATNAAHLAVMRSVRPGQHEYEAQAVFESECLQAGLRHLAYLTIAASGKNSAILHYDRNNAKLKAGDLLLMDAGAECRGYAADVTRTLPISGRFSRRQKDIYSIVLEAQKASIAHAQPGLLSTDLHIFSMTRIAEGLKSLKILRGDTTGLVENGAVRLFYPHGLSHMMGLDVHDVTGGKKRLVRNPHKFALRFLAKLEPGFVITIEPGIYFIEALLQDAHNRRQHRASVDFARAEKFLDFGGVRIEDDIVIQARGSLNLTDTPKEIKDVEAACRR